MGLSRKSKWINPPPAAGINKPPIDLHAGHNVLDDESLVPGGWEVDDGLGPQWLIYEENGVRCVARRGTEMYNLIIEGLNRTGRRR